MLDDPAIMSDRRPLLKETPEDDVSTPRSRRRMLLKRSHSVVVPRRRIIIEPVLVLYFTAIIATLPLNQQYMYSRFGNTTYIKNSNATAQCGGNLNASDPIHDEVDYMQKETAKWTQYITIAASLPAIFMVPLIGSYSDRVGRKSPLLLTCTLTIVKSIISVAVVFFELPVYVLVIGSAIDGLGGWALMMIAFTYLADITDPTSRAFRMVIGEGMIMLSSAISQIGMGYFISATGFLYPFIVVVGLQLVNLVYIIFFVPETLVIDNSKLSFTIGHLVKDLFGVFRETLHGRRTKLILLMFLIFTCVLPFTSAITIRILYTMNIPLCWGPIKIGIYGAVGSLLYQVMSISGVKIFKYCMSEMWISLIGIISNMAALLLNAFADTDWEMYLVTFVGGFSTLSAVMFRTTLSYLVHTDELGAIFAILASVETICSLVGTMASANIYRATLDIYPGFVFFVLGILLIIPIVLVLVYISFDRRINRGIQADLEDERTVQ